MRVAIDVASVRPPLTGIGRYTLELVNALTQAASGNTVHLLGALGREVPMPLVPPSGAGGGSLRHRIGRLAPARWVYRHLNERGKARALAAMSAQVFHGPAFWVPATDIPTVATVHDLSVFHLPEFHPPARVRELTQAIRETTQRASRIIAVSAFVRAQIIAEFGLSPERVVAISNGVSPIWRQRSEAELGRVLGRYSLAAGEYVLCVSTIEPRKNIPVLLEAFRALPPETRVSRRLVLAGQPGWNCGPDLRCIEAACKEGWASFLGYVPEGDLPFLVAGATAFAYPSVYEGFGLPVLEAMASGIPVIAANATAIPEVAGNAAVLVEPVDPSAWTAALARVLADDLLRAKLAKSGIEVAREFSWMETARKTLAVYKSVAR